jgi:hypothetical protein
MAKRLAKMGKKLTKLASNPENEAKADKFEKKMDAL